MGGDEIAPISRHRPESPEPREAQEPRESQVTAIEPIHDLIEILTATPNLAGAAQRERPSLTIVASAEGDAVVELRLFASTAAALAAVPAATPQSAGGSAIDPGGPQGRGRPSPPPPSRTLVLLREVRRQLTEYFAGARRVFDLPLDPRGTEFERRVWQEVAAIPYGTTRSYAQVARAAGSPIAFRAVGRANGRNPIPLVIPCHRVIGADGSLTGYGGGLPLKRYLLDLEGVAAAPSSPGSPASPAPDSLQLGLPLAAPGTAAIDNERDLYGIVRP
jgi:methylated-DNA-[protein]-cysteine S-methyltransferase